jgi:tRNA(Ile2) C34 agmatinyltransferase TiaS
MRTTAIYEVVCLCGATASSETNEIRCPKCGTEIRAEWPCVTRLLPQGDVHEAD